jgi:hypothetical protein
MKDLRILVCLTSVQPFQPRGAFLRSKKNLRTTDIVALTRFSDPVILPLQKPMSIDVRFKPDLPGQSGKMLNHD